LNGQCCWALSGTDRISLPTRKSGSSKLRQRLAAVLGLVGTGLQRRSRHDDRRRKWGNTRIRQGGIGGVHRGAETPMDISHPDGTRAHPPWPWFVRCEKPSLVARTMEVLETFGVRSCGTQRNDVPAFYSRESGLQLVHRVESGGSCKANAGTVGIGNTAAPARERKTGILFANPPPARGYIPRAEIETFIAAAPGAAEAGSGGKRWSLRIAAKQWQRLRGGKNVGRPNIDPSGLQCNFWRGKLPFPTCSRLTGGVRPDAVLNTTCSWPSCIL